MLDKTHTIRPARKSDADHLARFVNFAGEGLPCHFWQTLAADGEDPWSIGRERAARENSAFSWRHATIAEIGGRVAAGMVTYEIEQPEAQPDYSAMPAMFVPIQQLEDMVPGSWYVSVLAAYPQARGIGAGSQLLALAEKEAAGRPMSLIVADNNAGAIRLYERFGFLRHASRPMVKDGWQSAGENWILMLKQP